MMRDEITIACRATWKGRLVWIPPTGSPYFIDRNPAEDMTEDQLRRFMERNNEFLTGDFERM